MALVREDIGPLASFREVTIVEALPKTRSGKILRSVRRDPADVQHVARPHTREDPAVLLQLRERLVQS